MGATAHALGAATWETFAYDEEGNLLTPNFYDYHVPHALDMPPSKTGAIESPSPFSPLGTKGMGEGGGAGIHAVCAALQGRPQGRRRRHHPRQPQPLLPGLRDLAGPGGDAGRRERGERMNVEEHGSSTHRRERVWAIISDPAGMAGLMPGVEGFEVIDDTHWRAKVQGAARPRRAQDDDGLSSNSKSVRSSSPRCAARARAWAR